jgi:hypothetical protein
MEDMVLRGVGPQEIQLRHHHPVLDIEIPTRHNDMIWNSFHIPAATTLYHITFRRSSNSSIIIICPEELEGDRKHRLMMTVPVRPREVARKIKAEAVINVVG